MNKLFIETESCVLAQPNYLTKNLKARLFFRLLWGFKTLFYYACSELDDWKLWITRNRRIEPVVTTSAEDAVIEANASNFAPCLPVLSEAKGTGAKIRKALLKKINVDADNAAVQLELDDILTLKEEH